LTYLTELSHPPPILGIGEACTISIAPNSAITVTMAGTDESSNELAVIDALSAPVARNAVGTGGRGPVASGVIYTGAETRCVSSHITNTVV
jgi:hypothetical protein